MQSFRFVITGAAGFIGSRVLHALAEAFPLDSILVVDHPLTPDKSANLAPFPGHHFRPHDRFLADFESGTLHTEVLIHLGACSDTTQGSWDYLQDNNLRYTQRLWQRCATTGTRMINASSAATYGDGSRGFDDTTDLSLLQPLNLYGKSKHDFDLWQEDQIRRDAPRPPQYVGLKFFNVFGPGEAHKGRMASMVFHGHRQIREEGVVRLFQSHRPDYADGGQRRDFIYVRDVVRVIRALVERPHVNGLFNLGTGRAHSFHELIEALFLALDLPPRIDYVPMPPDLRDKYQYYTQATMDKIRAAGVPFEPEPLADSVADYVRNHLSR